jgi:hypothetical protein
MMYRPIRDYGIIGDTQTVALIIKPTFAFATEPAEIVPSERGEASLKAAAMPCTSTARAHGFRALDKSRPRFRCEQAMSCPSC